jgi:hypothetical protein
MDDLLGFDRYEQHRDWRCSGRVDGEVDEIEPLAFTMERHGERWLLATGEGELIAIGDQARDLVAADGGLVRRPATLGFVPYFSANLARQIGILAREWVASCEVVGSRESERAGRPAVDVDLRHGEYEIALGVDAETGVWTWLQTSGFTITVDRLDAGPTLMEAAALRVLDYVPDVDFSQREPVTEALAPALAAVQEASGLRVEVLYQDEDSGEFRFILLGSDGQPEALVGRSRTGSTQEAAHFGGVQHWWESKVWSYHIDTASADHMWSGRIMKAVDRLSI